MIPKRIIPMFLLKGKRLVKGTQFKGYIDVGDPMSQAMIYDAQGADEIIIVDIEASREKRIIDTNIITEMITKCRLPIVAGGGIKTIEDARKCFASGADKIVLNTQAVLNPFLIRKLANEFGSQSVVVSIDVKKNPDDEYDIYVFSGKQKVGIEFQDFVKKVIGYGAGEVMITSIDKEGTLSGFDYELFNESRSIVTVPFIASGGAGCYDDMVRLFNESDYDVVRIKYYLKGKKVLVREA